MATLVCASGQPSESSVHLLSLATVSYAHFQPVLDVLSGSVEVQLG